MKWMPGVLVTLALAGCATREVPFQPPAVSAVTADSPFTVSGRLSVQMNGKGQVANFEWAHTPDRDELQINTPIGTTVARLTRDHQGVTLESDGKSWQAPDVETLMQARMGWSLPLGNLAWWLRGRAAPGIPSDFDADGSLQQQGWRIRFVSDATSGAIYPSRVDLARDNLSIRLVTYRWQ